MKKSASKGTSRPVSQPDAERRSAEAELLKLVARFAPAHTRLIASARRWLRRRLPSAHELVYEYRDCFVISFSPNEHGYLGVFAVRGGEDGVRLYFNRGKELPDPGKLLQGTGGLVRWVPMERNTLRAAPVLRLVDEALAHNRVPFAHTGKGPIVIRSTLAQARNKRRSS